MKKTILAVAAVLLLLATNAVSFYIGRRDYDKVHEDACHMSDLIRCYKDHLIDPESVVEDYNLFEELEGLFLYDDCVSETPVKLENYSWCY